MIRVAVLGYGTIGSGVVEVLETNRQVLAKRIGDDIEVKYILDLREFPGDPHEQMVVHDFAIIENDPEVNIVVECMGGVEPAYTFASRALKAGKHFTTSNKALIAAKGPSLVSLAREMNTNCQFEASVGGGIPIIRGLLDCLAADVVEEISGILNGTTNYMMTKMSEEGSEFDDVLKDAQAKGYAEADPTADVEGYDACRKIAILTSLVSCKMVNFEEIHTEGITKISATDIKYAKALGRRIKLIASSYKVEDSYCALVAPFMIDASSPLFAVNDVFNGVLVKGNMLGDAMFYGSGAGKLPTASAVVADIVDISKHLHRNIPIEWNDEKQELLDYRKLENKYFIRTDADKAAVEAACGAVEYVSVDGIDETAFITTGMDGYAFDAIKEKLVIKQAIRVK